MGVFVIGSSANQSSKIQKTDMVTATGTWTAPNDVSSVELIICGGGAGGIGGSGGGGSAYNTVLEVVAGTTYTVTIGAGGVSDGAGSNTTFDALFTALGASGSNPRGLGGGGGNFAGANSGSIAGTGGAGCFGYGGGGGGGRQDTTFSSNPAPGANGGGYGRRGTQALDATPNSGSGGGGGSPNGQGGSGVCIIKYWTEG